MDTILLKIIEASPYLGFVLLFIWFEARREERRQQAVIEQEKRRVENAAALEARRETHEMQMQTRQLEQDRTINQLWASYIQQIVNEIKAGNTAIIQKITEHEEESTERYERMGITKDLLKAASEKTRR